MMDYQPMTYENIAGGRLAEQVDAKIAEVLKNIDDPNTPHETKRELIIKLTFKPNEDRDRVGITAAVTTKTAGFRAVETAAFLVNQRGVLLALEHQDPRQNELFPASETTPNPLPFASGQK